MANVSDVAKYFLEKDIKADGENGISNLKLQKLVYYAQGFSLALFENALFDEKIEAWQHGPVTPSLYREYSANNGNIIPHVENPDFNPGFTGAQVELLDEVFEVFGQFSAWKLRDMTHEEKPWLDNERHAGVISHAEMVEYFKTRIN